MAPGAGSLVQPVAEPVPDAEVSSPYGVPAPSELVVPSPVVAQTNWPVPGQLTPSSTPVEFG